MPSHKFQVGETVYVRRAISRNVPSGAYVVTKQLPHNGREFEYRIKCKRGARACRAGKRTGEGVAPMQREAALDGAGGALD
jgi:hypothetical protein